MGFWDMHVSFRTVLALILLAFTAGLFAPAYLGVTGFTTAVTPTPAVSFSGIQGAFCPSPTCVSLPISALETAHERVWVAMYSFTNTELADALIAAKQRGADVRVIVEKQQAGSQYSQHDELAAAGIPVRIDTNPNLMHDKFAVLDEDIVITGSMNWTGNGVRENNENVLVIHSDELNQQFATEFQKIWDESEA